MRSALVMCLLCVACKSSVRAPVSDLYAITDGKVTLGVVASENEEGLQAYRLLLCRNHADYSNVRVFADSSMCMPALVDNAGQEVLIFPDRLRRPFAAKVANYAKIAVGAALVAGAGYGAYKWFAKGSKYLKNLEEVADDAYNTRIAEIKQKHQEEIAEIKKGLDSLETEKLDNLLDVELPRAYKQADAEEVDKVMKNLNTYYTYKEGKYTHLGDAFEQELGTKNIDADLLQGFSQNLDEKLAVAVRKARLSVPFQTNINDVHYFHSRFVSSKAQFDKTVRAKLQAFADRKTTTLDLSDAEKTIMLLTEKHATDYESALLIQVLHKQRDLLLQFKQGKLTAEDLTALKPPPSGGNILSYANSINSLISPALLEPNHRDTQAWSILRKIDRHPDVNQARKVVDDEAITSSIDFVASSPQKQQLDEKISKLSDEINTLNLELMNNTFNSQIRWRFQNDSELGVWQKIKNYIDASSFPAAEYSRLIEEEIAVLKNNIKLRKAELQANTAIRDMADTASKNIEEANKKLNQLLIAQQEKSVARMEEALQLAKQGRDREVAAIVQEAEDARTSALGLTLASALGGSAVLASLDKSIWGYGEKQLGNYWSQIFSDKASFADAAAVEDMPAVLYKLAEVLGYKVNTAALQLAQ